MKNSKLFILLLAFVAFACSKETQKPNAKDSINEGIQLESPKGILFAKDFSDLKGKLANEKPEIKNPNEIAIGLLEYYESDGVSVAIVNYRYLKKEYSSLYMLQIPENYIVLHDEHSLRFVKKTSVDENETADILNFEPTIQSFGIGDDPPGSARCFGSKCCKWKKTAVNTYNCGCPPAMSR